jgi:hypothetical protein
MTNPGPLAANPWTPEDDYLLRLLVKNGMHIRAIALHVKRTPTDIRWRTSRLNILLRQAKPQKQMMG